LTIDQLRELEHWQDLAFRKLKQGKSLMFPWVSKTLPEEVASVIRDRLPSCKTLAEIERAFDLNMPDTPDRQLRELADALNKAVEVVVAEGKYSPNQPRVPAGDSDGGQWTDGSGDGGTEVELTSDEIDSIKKYTLDDYMELNENLRNGTPLSDAQELLEYNLKSAIDKAGATDKEYALYRGIHGFRIDAEVGDVIVDKGFVSTTTLTLEEYGTRMNGTRLEIFVPKGSEGVMPVWDWSGIPEEYEVLINSGAMFKVLEATPFIDQYGVTYNTYKVVYLGFLGGE